MADFNTGVRILSAEEAAALAQQATPKPEDNNPPQPLNQEEPPVSGIRITGPSDNPPPVTPTGAEDVDEESTPPPVAPPTSKTEGSEKVNVNFQKLAEVLSDKGLFDLPEDGKIESEEDILTLMRDKINKESQDVFKAWKEGLPEAEQAFLGFREAGYSTDEAIQLSEYQEFASTINEKSTEQAQEQMYRLYLESKGLDEDEIKESIESAKDLDKLGEKAVTSKEKVLKMIADEKKAKEIATQQMREQAQQRQQQKFTSLMSKIENTKELIPGINITPKMQQKIKDSMTLAVETVDGQELNQLAAIQRKNPEDFNILLHYYASIGLFNMDKNGKFKPDVSNIATKMKSQISSSLAETISSDSKTANNQGKQGEENSLLAKLEKYGKFNF